MEQVPTWQITRRADGQLPTFPDYLTKPGAARPVQGTG